MFSLVGCQPTQHDTLDEMLLQRRGARTGELIPHVCQLSSQPLPKSQVGLRNAVDQPHFNSSGEVSQSLYNLNVIEDLTKFSDGSFITERSSLDDGFGCPSRTHDLRL